MMLGKQKLLALMIPLALLSTGKIIAATSQIPDSLYLPTRSVRYVMANVTNALGFPVTAGSDAYGCFPKTNLRYIAPSSNLIKHIYVLPEPLTTINNACDSLATVLKNSMTKTTANLQPVVQKFTDLNTSNASLQSQVNSINGQITDIKMHQSGLFSVQKNEVMCLAELNTVTKYRDDLTAQLNDLQAKVRVKPTALTPQPVVDTNNNQVVAASTSSTAISKPEPIVVPSKQLKIYKKKKHRHRKHHHWYGMHHHNKRK
ncbi:MAG: hypothetical protein NT128_00315 [Proteobacteria bacterium]|nr:hypothetical protein [Pseudomonadota bacterium]